MEYENQDAQDISDQSKVDASCTRSVRPLWVLSGDLRVSLRLQRPMVKAVMAKIVSLRFLGLDTPGDLDQPQWN